MAFEYQTQAASIEDTRTAFLTFFAPHCGERERNKRARKLRDASAAILDDLFHDLNKALGVENLLECGAHEATASSDFMKAGGKRAIAIEANPHVFLHRTSKAKEHGVEVHNIGLANKSGVMDFHLPKGKRYSGSSSFNKRADGSDPIEVQVTTIDRLVKEQKIKGPATLWVDVEGFAYQVLSGAKTFLKHKDCMLMKLEIEDAPRWPDQKIHRDVDRLIKKFGFQPVFCDIEYVHQFNVILVKKDILDQCEAEVKNAYDALNALVDIS